MKKILIADDNEFLRELLRGALKDSSHAISEAADGPAVIEAVEREPPDLVILDLMLPGRHGLDLLRTIKQDRPEIAVIILTGLHSSEISEAASEAGASAFLTKPVPLVELRAAVERCLGPAAQPPPKTSV